MCDGEQDCFEGFDEIGCPKITCGEDKFQCKSGQCISIAWRCGEFQQYFCPLFYFTFSKILIKFTSFFFSIEIDGEIDCSSDSSDEDNCHTNGTNTVCKPNYFQCADGKNCIPATWQW